MIQAVGADTETVVLACSAMGTRFELVLCGDDECLLRSAGEAAIEEVLSAHERLTAFDRASVVSAINAAAGVRPVRVDSELLGLFSRCEAIRGATGGAFDISVGRLMETQGFRRSPSPTPGAAARSSLVIDQERSTVMLSDATASIDLGGVGKGFALDLAAGVLRDAGVTSALMHGGTSTAYAIGRRPDGERWAISVPAPEPHTAWLRVEIEDTAVSVSAACDPESRAGHILDPATGAPVSTTSAAVAADGSAADADAWSTAMAVTGVHGSCGASALWRGQWEINAGQDRRACSMRVEAG